MSPVPNDTRRHEEGVGLYRGPGEPIREQLEPGQPPHPSEGYQGPSISVPIEGYEKMVGAIESMAKHLALETRPDYVAGVALGTTDASGNAALTVYRVAAGMEARAHRVTVNGIVAATNVPYTAAVPFQADTAYMELHEAESAGGTGPSGLIDFAPAVAKAQLLPWVWRWSFDQAAFVRGPNEFALVVHAGPASTRIVVRYQLNIRRARGVA